MAIVLSKPFWSAALRIALVAIIVAAPALVSPHLAPQAAAEETSCKDRDGDGECDLSPSTD